MEILLATTLIACSSLIGVLIFGRKHSHVWLERTVVPFAIGTFLGVTFFELIPETLEVNASYGATAIMVGFLVFYLLAHLLRTYHHHHHDEEETDVCEATRSSAGLLLVGDAVHNFVDGVVITSAFLINPVVGWVTTLGVLLHEVPQEIAEYGVLLRAGYSTKQAAAYNLLSATTVIVGAGVTIVAANTLPHFIWILTGVAAGNLLYVALSDLIPGVQASARQQGRFYEAFLITVLGLVSMVSLITLSHGEFGHSHSHDDDEGEVHAE